MANPWVLSKGDEVEHGRENERGFRTKSVDKEYGKGKSQRMFWRKGAESICSGLQSFGVPTAGDVADVSLYFLFP